MMLIVFRVIATNEISRTTVLDTAGVEDYRSVIGCFTKTTLKDLRLVSGCDAFYDKIKSFDLFEKEIALEDANPLRNLFESAETKTLMDMLQKCVNALTVQDKDDARISDSILL